METPQVRQDLIDKETLREYIAYARLHVHPVLTDASVQRLIDAYTELRESGRQRKVVVATPRQLESLVRLSEALARMELRSEVEPRDVDEAVRLWYAAMQSSAVTKDGQLDIDMVTTGTSAADREAQRALPGQIRIALNSMQVRTRAGRARAPLSCGREGWGARAALRPPTLHISWLVLLPSLLSRLRLYRKDVAK